MMRISLKPALFFLIICSASVLFSVAAFAQAGKALQSIQLKGETVTATDNVRKWIQDAGTTVATKGPVQVLLHFAALPDAAQKAVLKQNGITLLDYIPDNTFVAIVQGVPDADKVQAAQVNSIITSKPEWKADSYLWKRVANTQGQVEVLVSFYPGTGIDAIKKYITDIGGRIDPGPMEQYGAYKVILASGAVKTLAAWYGTTYISPVTPMVPLDLQTRPIIKGNIAVAPVANGGYNLLGDGITVGVGDNTSGIFHSDLRDRITNFNPARITKHGVHVNGIIGGAGIIDPRAEGQAPHVNLVNFFFDQILPATGAMYHDYNMTLTNNSYTVIEGDCDYPGTYDLYSKFLDTLSVQYPEVQHVFASGNDGLLHCSPYPQGFATVGGGYQPAKNNIVVGSMTNQIVKVDDESRGPVKDGRLKPEIISVGYGVYSTILNVDYIVTAGTSMASPQVVGGLTSLTERYKQLHGGAQPRADLLKTVLLSACTDLGNPGPDFSYGFGAMDVARSLKILDDNRYTTNDINNGNTQTFTITVPANTAQVKVMLCWSDVPASPISAKQLINDLDLTVTDPSSGNHLPLVLDASPANVDNNAVEKEDHLNNVEQVTINTPVPGTYTITVKGYSVPDGPQHYVIAYDIIPKELQLTFPLGGEQLSNADSIRVVWNAIPDGNTFSVFFSPDNGSNWQTISTSIPGNVHYCGFLPTGVNSGNCIVRVSRNGTSETNTSQRFAITTQTTVNLYPSQCPGYRNVHWSPVPNATAYQVLKKIGPYMQVVDTVADTLYSFGGLSQTELSYVAVRPIVNGIPGYRSMALFSVANTGDCLNPVSLGDLFMERVLSPQSGRMNTSTALSASTQFIVQIRNLYAFPCNNYTVSYRVNSGLWQMVTNPGTIPANGSLQISLPALNLAASGTYSITVAVHNLDVADPQPGNDTTNITIKNLPNTPVDLTTPFTDGFEDMSAFSTVHDSMGVSPNAHWDYANSSDSGRIRSFVFDSVAITGNRSVSLDAYQPILTGSKNNFTGTFNFSGYDTATTEIRVDFDYLFHGIPTHTEGNTVVARGMDTAAWVSFFNYDFSAYPGYVQHVRSLSLTDAVLSGNRNFSSSTQMSFLQNDTSIIAAKNYGCGISLDNFKIYTVANDAMISQIVSPAENSCGLPGIIPLTVQVHNGVNYTLHDIHLFYSMDSGTVFTGTIDTIKAKGTINYTFPTPLNIGSVAAHKLNVWLVAGGDTYLANDSVLNYKFRNSNIISNFPYLENFESGDGGYFTDGFNSSWQYGVPASNKINSAASGAKAWKTNLTGRYNALEKSYLYMPCFDIAQLAHPRLSFSLAQDLENCGGTLCDGAWMEYSFDGMQWTKLGSTGNGTNWYDSTFNIWNTNNFTRWHVASIALPQPPTGAVLHLRFVLSADPAVNFEGLAVDDIHIYDFNYPVFPSSTISLARDVSGSNWQDFLPSDQLLASIQPNNQTISNTTVTLYGHDTVSNPAATQYTFPRSYTIKAAQSLQDSVGLRLYLKESDIVAVVKDTTCPSCTDIKDAYTLGITQYNNYNNSNAENGTLADDTGGIFTFTPYQRIKWVPYDDGYYAEFKTKSLSEYWFNNGGPTGNFPAGIDYLNFVAFKSGGNVNLYWYSPIDTAVSSYTIERSDSSIVFDSVTTITSTHGNPGEYTYSDPANFSASGALYYRLNWQMTGRTTKYYSPVRKITEADSAAGLVKLAAVMAGSNNALVSWTSYIDAIAASYILERAIDNGDYKLLQTTNAIHHYGQQYFYNDMPDEQIRNGEPVHYRLTVIMTDGSHIVVPISTVYWINGSAVLDIYPNPTRDGNFSIRWFAATGSNMDMQITDAVGKTLYDATFTAMQWANTADVRLSFHPKGVYFVKMMIGGTRYTARLVYD